MWGWEILEMEEHYYFELTDGKASVPACTYVSIPPQNWSQKLTSHGYGTQLASHVITRRLLASHGYGTQLASHVIRRRLLASHGLRDSMKLFHHNYLFGHCLIGGGLILVFSYVQLSVLFQHGPHIRWTNISTIQWVHQSLIKDSNNKCWQSKTLISYCFWKICSSISTKSTRTAPITRKPSHPSNTVQRSHFSGYALFFSAGVCMLI